MSPRAACRLEGLGFSQVYDYVGGIADWKAAGLPTEGNAGDTRRVADAARSDVPTCRLDEPMGEVLSRITSAEWDVCVVLDCDGIVVGRLRRPAIDDQVDLLVEEAMEPGPATVRPDGLLEPLVGRMHRRNAPHVLVTTAQGHLIGVLLRDEASRLLAGETPQRIWQDCDGCPGRWARETPR
jgi:CBS domain-containing protein